MVDRDFLHLRQYCVEIVESPSREAIRAFSNALSQTERGSVQQMQEYLFVPLFEVFRTKKRTEEIMVDAVECITQMLSLITVHNFKLFSKLAFDIIMLVSNREETVSVPLAAVSEELKLSVATCMTELIKCSSESVLESMHGVDFFLQLGHIVYVLLRLAESEGSRDLRCAAMKCIEMIGTVKGSENLRLQFGNSLANLIPGITLTLTKVATDSGLSGQVVTVTALNVWQKLVCVVMDDEQLKITHKMNHSIAASGHLPKLVQRNKEWSKGTAQNLSRLIHTLSSLDSHSHWKVRLALAQWARNLLTRCYWSLSVAASSLVSVLITLSSDEYDEVASVCKEGLEEFSRTLTADKKSLIEVLQENLLELVLQLPRVIQNSDDSKKLSTVNKLCGYFAILGPSLNLVINSSIHLEKLSTCLMQLMEIDCSDIQLVAERKSDAVYTLEELEELSPNVMRKCFKHFRDERIHVKVIEICQLFGKFGDLQLLTDHSMDQFHKSAVFRKESTLLLNYIILGFQFHTSYNEDYFQKELVQVLSYVVDEYLDPSVWDLQTVLRSDGEADSDHMSLMLVGSTTRSLASNSILTLNSNVVQICLLLEGLGNISKILKVKFCPLLVKVLYEVLDKLGNSNVTISQMAFLIVSKISIFCGYNSISNVLLQNADYLLSSLSLKLHYKPLDNKGPLVFCVALEHSDHRMLDVIQDVLKEVLTGLDNHYNEKSLPFLQVLHSFVNAISRWYPPKSLSELQTTDVLEEVNNKDIKRFIIEYHQLKQVNEQTIDDETSNAPELEKEQTENEPIDDNEKKQSPKHVLLVVEVLDRCCHHLPSNNLSIRLLVLDILDASIQVLKDYEDDLLPMVHKTWAPLSQRFKDDNLLSMKKAFHTVCTICKTCGNFVRNRVITEIWPKLVTFLEKHVEISAKKEGTSFHYTTSYKLLLEVLLNVGGMVKQLRIPELEVDRLASATVVYLSKHQPTSVQDAALKLMEELSDCYPDLIWLKLYDLYSDESCLTHKSSSFATIKVGGNYLNNVEFVDNVKLLLNRKKCLIHL